MKAEKRLAAVLLSLALLFVSGFFPAYGMNFNGLTDRSTEAAEWLEANPSDYYPERMPLAHADSGLPSSFDLRDRGVVTPVKLQTPFATCWGFAAIAAAETSILSELGTTYEETGLDFSEHHLAYFARTPMPEGGDQAGEGSHLILGDPMDAGGLVSTATDMFSSGIGPVYEDFIPYRGTRSRTDTELIYNLNYSADDDWTIPEDCRFIQAFKLEETKILRDPSIYDPETDRTDFFDRESGYIGYDAAATEAIKQAVYDGYAVYVAFCADDYLPGYDMPEFARYINTKDGEWAHFTHDGGVPNHAVAIVGWDDGYSAEHFLDHTYDQYGDETPHRPEGDGAWIVKNSWGSEQQSFPNEGNWGIPDENGNGTGYFMLSYYDRSATDFEILDFDVLENDVNYFIEEYDYMSSEEYEVWTAPEEISMMNVFAASSDGYLSSVAYTTQMENSEVLYRVYRADNMEEPVAERRAFYDLPGYHREVLEEPVYFGEGEECAVEVVERLHTPDGILYSMYLKMGWNEEYVRYFNFEEERCSYPYEPEYSIDDYWKGVVNPGESFLYLGKIGQYTDLSNVVKKLQQTETYEGYDFDNFSIRAYFDYSSEEAANSSEGITAPEYASPKGKISLGEVLKLIYALLFVGGVVVCIVLTNVSKAKRRRKINQRLADYRQQVYLLERYRDQINARLYAAEKRLAAAEEELDGFRKAEAQQTEFQQADVQQETAGDSTEAVAAEEQNRSGMPAEWPGHDVKGEYNENTDRDNGQHADPV